MRLGFGNWIFAVLKSRSTVEKHGLGWAKESFIIWDSHHHKDAGLKRHTPEAHEPSYDKVSHHWAAQVIDSDGYHWGSTYIFLLTPFLFSFFTLLTLFCLSLCVLCVWGGGQWQMYVHGLVEARGQPCVPFLSLSFLCLPLHLSGAHSVDDAAWPAVARELPVESKPGPQV